MNRTLKKILLVLVAGILAVAGLVGCASDADVASENLSKAADNFEVPRRIVFYNGITNEYILEVIGYCALGNYDSTGQLSVTCKSPEGFKKHFLGLSDNVTWFAEQLDPKKVSTDFYRVNFKPTSVIPDIQPN